MTTQFKKYLRHSWNFFYQTFLGLGLGKLFPARESFLNDILAGDGNTAKTFITVANSSVMKTNLAKYKTTKYS